MKKPRLAGLSTELRRAVRDGRLRPPLREGKIGQHPRVETKMTVLEMLADDRGK
jgi:hypothetical protein